MSNRPDSWKALIITWGITLLFILKFGKFLVLEAWDVIGPLVRCSGELSCLTQCAAEGCSHLEALARASYHDS